MFFGGEPPPRLFEPWEEDEEEEEEGDADDGSDGDDNFVYPVSIKCCDKDIF